MQLPNNTEKEMSILAASILSVESREEICHSIVEDDFYAMKNQKLFECIKINKNEDISIERLFHTLSEKNYLEKCGGSTYLYHIMDTPVPSGLSKAIKELKELTTLRNKIINAQKVIESCLQENDVPFSDTEIENWIHLAPGEFNLSDIDRDLTIKTPSQKKRRLIILEKLIKTGVLERANDRRGFYRPAQTDLVKMDYINADERGVDVWLPFGIDQVVKIFPSNIIQINGQKNAGKTGFVLNIAKENRDRYKIHYFNSEMGRGELKERLKLFGDITPDMWQPNFNAYERSSNFSDVIFPGEGNINIIDFLECHDNFYKMGQYMRDIHEKLKGAIAVICVQKNPGNEQGIGGSRTEEKPRLILNINPGTLKIKMAKNWKSKENPNGKSMDFKLVGGCKFYEQGGWYI